MFTYFVKKVMRNIDNNSTYKCNCTIYALSTERIYIYIQNYVHFFPNYIITIRLKTIFITHDKPHIIHQPFVYHITARFIYLVTPYT